MIGRPGTLILGATRGRQSVHTSGPLFHQSFLPLRLLSTESIIRLNLKTIKPLQ